MGSFEGINHAAPVCFLPHATLSGIEATPLKVEMHARAQPICVRYVALLTAAANTQISKYTP
jgi:hypothetical protein